MENFALPFPGRELADKELTYDFCYGKIPESDRARIVEDAWQKGCDAAKQIFSKENGSTDFFAIAQKNGLSILKKDIDFVSGNNRYFSDYVSGRSEITLYLKSVELWAKENHLDLDTAQNLILSHEYFHFLEVTQLGLTSRSYQVPMIQIGKIKIGKTGIRALSEIGAHAFARTYFELIRSQG